MKNNFKAVFVLAVSVIFTVTSCMNVVVDNDSFEPRYVEPIITYDSVERIGTERYALVASHGDDVFGLKITENGSNFVLSQIDADTYLPVEGKATNVNNLNPTSLFVDDEFIYISSKSKGNAGRNKVLVYRKDNLSGKQIGSSWNFSDGHVYHPAGVGADEKYIYIVSGKTNVVRVIEKATVRNNWNGDVKTYAYIKMPAGVPHDDTTRATVYASNGLLLISFGGNSAVYKFNVSDLYTGNYANLDSAKSAEDTLPIPFNKTALNNIAVNHGYASLQLGDNIIIMEEAKFKNLNFSDYAFALSSNANELSIATTKKLNGAFTVYTCEKDSTIKKTVPLVHSISTVADGSRLTEIVDGRLIVGRDEMFKPQDTMALKSQYKIRLRQPIESSFDNGKLVLRSFYMKDLNSAKFAIKIKGMSEEVIVLDIKETLSPFQIKYYKMPILSEGGVFKTVSGKTVQISKLNPTNIVSTRIIHNDKSLKAINNLAADWSISFSGTEGGRYIPIMREDARNYIQTYTNMAYAFASPVMNDCLDHFTYFTRVVFIEDVAGISDSRQTAWYHLDKSDKYYNAGDKKRFLDRVGVTDKWISHWSLSIDTSQVGVASAGGAAGGGWLALSRGAFNQSGEDVITYILAHEFGHSRNWQHGSSFAYGAFSDRANNSRLDYITDMLPNIGKTLLHMGVLPYMDQFSPSAYDYMALDQIEAKVYLSGKKDWWSPELWNHVQKKVKAINDYADGIDNSSQAKINLIKERVVFLKQHFENWKVANNKTGNNNQYFIQWRNAVSNNKELAWMKENMPGRSGAYKSYWDEINETYNTGIPFDKIETKAVNALSTKVNRDAYLNKWGFTNNTAFTILDNCVCHHPGHSY